jgi:hypothetical protein
MFEIVKTTVRYILNIESLQKNVLWINISSFLKTHGDDFLPLTAVDCGNDKSD